MATIEGKNAVLEALRAGRPLKEILFAEGLRSEPRLQEIVKLAKAAEVPMRHLQRRRLASMSVRGAHQGVIARAEEFHYRQLEEFLPSLAGSARAVIVVIDGVTDPQNLGSMIRTAEVAGAKGLVVGRRRAAGIGPAAEKAAAGATEHLPIVQVTNVPAALEKLKEAGFWVMGTSAEAGTELWEADLSRRVALVFGSEGKGIGRLVRDRCDGLVKIPVFGRIDSLNVSAAAAIVLYETIRQERERLRKTGT